MQCSQQRREMASCNVNSFPSSYPTPALKEEGGQKCYMNRHVSTHVSGYGFLSHPHVHLGNVESGRPLANPHPEIS